MPRRLPLILLAAVVSLSLAACGDKQETVTRGVSEAEYVTLGNMQYQVQLSRQLNRAAPGDTAQLVGIPVADRGLNPDQIWFGVWVRVFNGSDQAQHSADEFKIVDTRGTSYDPIKLATINPFAYRSTAVAANGQYPLKGSVSADLPNTGALVLFKLPVDALDFRPLELEFSGAGATRPSSVELDV